MKRGLIIAGVCLFFLSLNLISASSDWLVINSPLNEDIYDKMTVTFNLTSTSGNADFYYFTESLDKSPGKWVRLCKNNESCIKEIRFTEGEHNISIKAVNSSGDVDYAYVSFEIDTKKPKIIATKPNSNSVFNGSGFFIKYTEDHLKIITLYYGDEIENPRNFTKTDCAPGKNKNCTFNVDLKQFHNKKIYYWFEVNNSVNSAKSKSTIIKVDAKRPVNYSQEIVEDAGKVRFIFEMFDDNFKGIYYLDKKDSNPRWIALCSILKFGRCDVKRNLKSGNPKLDVKAVDKAGNELMIYEDEPITI